MFNDSTRCVTLGKMVHTCLECVECGYHIPSVPQDQCGPVFVSFFIFSDFRPESSHDFQK